MGTFSSGMRTSLREGGRGGEWKWEKEGKDAMDTKKKMWKPPWEMKATDAKEECGYSGRKLGKKKRRITCMASTTIIRECKGPTVTSAKGNEAVGPRFEQNVAGLGKEGL